MPKRRGRKPRVPLSQLLPALVFHFMNAAGTLSEHFAQLFAAPLADSSFSERRARLPWEVFTELMRLGLRPLADRAAHPAAFWRGWRLVALDGTQFSLTNTPQVKATARKAKSRRGRAAFAKITTGVLLELGLHNPLAAAIGRGGQSEWALALELLAQLPARALLLADRLHGCAAFIAAAWVACEKVGSHFLIRARTNIKVQGGKRCKDGSRLVRVPVRQKGKPRVIVQWLELREIRVRVQRPGHRAQELRLWTSLLDPARAPAQELIELYARRWEHELYYRELKRQLRKSEVLQSHTVETGAQEIAAVVLASALLARERARAATGVASVLRVSFHQDAGVDAAVVADAGPGRRFVERAPETTTDRALPGAGRALRDATPAAAPQLSAGRASAGERLAAAAPQSILGRPGAVHTPLTMNSRKALCLV